MFVSDLKFGLGYEHFFVATNEYLTFIGITPGVNPIEHFSS